MPASPSSVALVIASYAGSLAPGTSHHMTEQYLPGFLRHYDRAELAGRLQIFLYVACDHIEEEGTALVGTRARIVQNPQGSAPGWRWPAKCKLPTPSPRAVGALQPACDRAQNLRCSITFLANIGREAQHFLYHLLRVYAAPDLADLTFFVQEGEPWGLEYLFECFGGLHGHMPGYSRAAGHAHEGASHAHEGAGHAHEGASHAHEAAGRAHEGASHAHEGASHAHHEGAGSRSMAQHLQHAHAAGAGQQHSLASLALRTVTINTTSSSTFGTRGMPNASTTSACSAVDLGPLAPHDLYFTSPHSGVCHGACSKRSIERPDMYGKLDPLLRACGLPSEAPHDDLVDTCHMSAAAAAATGIGHAADGSARALRPKRVEVRMAESLVRHLDGVCDLAAALVASPGGWPIPGRGTFAVHRDAIRSPPLALYAELYAMASSPVIENAPFRSLSNCSARCAPGWPGPIKCGPTSLAGDNVAYVLEGLWAIVFGAVRARAPAEGHAAGSSAPGGSKSGSKDGSKEEDRAVARHDCVRFEGPASRPRDSMVFPAWERLPRVLPHTGRLPNGGMHCRRPP